MRMAGIVLAGGKSSRYRKQKIFERYNGSPFYKHSIHSFLQAGLDGIYVITNQELYPHFHKQKEAVLLVEDSPYQGPLYALTYGFRTLSKHYDWFFVLPADSPFVTVNFILQMKQIASREVNTCEVLLPVSGKKWQPLHGVYHSKALTAAEKCITEGKRSMIPLIHSLRKKEITFPADQRDFININRPEDWGEACSPY